ncbi:glucokinase [Limnohabitans sp. 2KL-1]|uniref:glucokinase n=1 Tax=Limnohabitans sp. 2KL-1 TaxID=1100699 RepID=UPI000D3BA8B7|nr:glucokinase [Limnohabitans sp. 2KL-1]PUE46792.1 glucokinase [Limnohabitans sp. 2KL-1]
MPLFPRLLGDVGGTNARFAWQASEGAPLTQTQVLPCAQYPGIAEAIEAYLQITGLSSPAAAGIGIANPITGDQVVMTNHHWSFSIDALQQRLSLQRLKVINDFTALALALPSLTSDQKIQIGGGAALDHAPVALLGAGTGLGVSGLMPSGAHWLPIAGEGGHVTLAAQTAQEFRVIERIQQKYGHASAERVLSGQGLVDLYQAMAQEHGPSAAPVAQSSAAAPLTAREISQRALKDRDPFSLACLDMFAGFLGTVAGDLALTLGARGGVYIGGGIVPRFLGWFETSSFRQRFEAKGRFATYLSDIPVWVIQAQESPALLGATRALDDR